MHIALSSVSEFHVGNQSVLFSQKDRIWTGSDIFHGFSSVWSKGWLMHQSGNILPPTATSRMRWNWRKPTANEFHVSSNLNQAVLPGDRKEPLEYHYPLSSKYFALQIHPFPRIHPPEELRSQWVRCRRRNWSPSVAIPLQRHENLTKSLEMCEP